MLRRCWLLVCFALLAGCATVRVSESMLIGPDLDRLATAQIAPGYRMQPIAVHHPDGVSTHGVWYQRERVDATQADAAVAATTVVYFGGNQFHLDQNAAPVVSALSALGVDFVIVDHRGYGRSEGSPTIALLHSDALDLIDQLRAQAPARLLLYGHSIGSFIAAGAAAERAVDGLILEGTSTDVDEWAHTLTPWYARPFVSVRVDANLAGISNLRALSAYRGPLLILSGANDSQTPPRLARRLYREAASVDKRFVSLPGRGHESVLDDPLVRSALGAFLAAQR